MKNTTILMCLLVGIGIRLTAQTHKELSEEFVQHLAAGQYEDAAKMFDPTIAAVNKEVLATGWQQIESAFGKYESYYLPANAAADANPVVVGVRFKNATKGFACNFNDKKELVGFLLAPAPKENTEEENFIKTPEGFREEQLSIPVKGGHIAGTLLVPTMEKAGSMPIAMIIAGSGPTDRNGNSLQTGIATNSYQYLAAFLATQKIASFRYDKRMVGASNDFSMAEEKDLRFEDYVQDAVAISHWLEEKYPKSKMYIMGHSEGSLIGMLAAQKVKPAAFVSLCGAGENIANVLKRQMPDTNAARVIDDIKAGKQVDDVPANLQLVFRASVQPYLRSWMQYDPANELGKLKMPILIVGGSTDIQVPVGDAEQLKEASPNSQLLVVPGMNHVLKNAPAEQAANIATYSQPGIPLSQGLEQGLREFFKTLER
ncbi:MAG: alpha/beta hydrolase [Edaphocola sp.]